MQHGAQLTVHHPADHSRPPGSSSAALLLIYGFPITLLGFALSYAQLKPVPCKTTDEALRLRESQATDIQKSVRALLLRPARGDLGVARVQRSSAGACLFLHRSCPTTAGHSRLAPAASWPCR